MRLNLSTRRLVQNILLIFGVFVLVCIPINVSAQKKNKKVPVVNTENVEVAVVKEENTFEYLGLLMNANESEDQLFYYDRPHVISMIGCTNCEIRAFTYFETDPDKKEYLDTIQFKVEPTDGLIPTTECDVASSFAYKYGKTLRVLIGWAPIAPITLEFYKDGVKLPVERQFTMSY
jgi:hypothetical protein